MILRASGTTWSGGPGKAVVGARLVGWRPATTPPEAAMGRGGGVGANTAAASPAVLLPGALTPEGNTDVLNLAAGLGDADSQVGGFSPNCPSKSIK